MIRCKRAVAGLPILLFACSAAPPQESGPAPAVKLITSFERDNPFSGGTVVAAHPTDGSKALLVGRPYSAMDSAQDWSAYDYLKVDAYTDASEPLMLTVEIHDKETTNYRTRVNYETVVPPGASTLILLLKQFYVGDRAHPGRGLILNGITRLVFAPGKPDGASLFLDNLRLERDTARGAEFFDGVRAFDFGPKTGRLMDGFTSVTSATLYTPALGYGLKNAKVSQFDELQPDPLYEDSVCIQSGSFVMDVPNGKYRVFLNVDSPGGFWGDTAIWRERSILAQGKRVLSEQQDFDTFQKKYFYFWDKDDLPSENVFDKYGAEHFREKTYDVDVTKGPLSLEFNGYSRACCVSTVIAFPLEKAAEGARFLAYVKEQRRFSFDLAYKRVLHGAAGDPLRPSPEDERRGYVLFERDFMKDVYYNDTPFQSEVGQPLAAEAFAGQPAVATLGIVPLKDLDTGSVTVSALTGPNAVIPNGAIEVGYVSYRLTRVTMSGSVYTITPRYVIPRNHVAMPRGIARRFWLAIHTPAVPPGTYTGLVTFTPRQGEAASIPLRLTVLNGSLDAVDIPVGPFGFTIETAWFKNDPKAVAFNAEMTERGMRLLRAQGFTMFSGVPSVVYQGFRNGAPVFDFHAADSQMEIARKLGFLAVNSYGAGVTGLNPYYQDDARMKAAGFTDYSAFIKAVYGAIERHAEEKNWLPVYWSLGDEPSGDALKKSVDNATAYRTAFPNGPPFFTAATSLSSHDAENPHFALAKALHVVTLQVHDEASVEMLRHLGGQWAFYNTGGDRWTYGDYLYKAAREFGLKFRLAWFWDGVAGDPYYALDCREDDYAWVNSGPEGLVPSVQFFRVGAGLDDYRLLSTLARLAKARPGTPAAISAEELIRTRMGSFHLGDLDHDRLFGIDDWTQFRRRAVAAIEALQ
jgi:hypothetical protein